VADHPLRPATDHRLGRPLPHQLANPTRAPPRAINLSPAITRRAHAVLAEVSLGYPPLQGRFPRATHPCATRDPSEPKPLVRLACVRHAASVRSEPGSNSHVHPEQYPQQRHPKELTKRRRHQRHSRLTGPPNARHLLPSANVQRPNAAARASLPHPTMSINKTRPAAKRRRSHVLPGPVRQHPGGARANG
jgi:hypothetical protein